jgi:bile acid:Na+ symporter, BASS family
MVDFLSKIVLPIAMFTMMFAMGLTLTPQDFKKIMVFPKAVLLGLFLQLLLLPAIGFAVVSVFPLKTMVAVGFVTLAASPSGTLSNVVVHIGKGNTALSITLTALATMVTLFTLPLWINFALRSFRGTETMVEVPIMQTALELGMFTLVPVSIGLFARSRAPHWEKIEPYLTRGSALTTFIIFVVVNVLDEGKTLGSPGTVLLPCALLTATAVLLGFGIPRVSGVDVRDSVTVAVETCMKNVVLPIFIAMTSLQDLDATLASAVYMVGMVPAAVAVMIIFNFFKKWKGEVKDVIK